MAIALVDILCPLGDRVEAGTRLIVVRKSGSFGDGQVRYAVLRPRIACHVTEDMIDLQQDQPHGQQNRR